MIKSVLIGGIALSLIAKFIIHIYLDRRHNRFQGFGPATMQHPSYFLPYYLDVKPQYETVKRVCNFLYYSIFILIVLLITWASIIGDRISGRSYLQKNCAQNYLSIFSAESHVLA